MTVESVLASKAERQKAKNMCLSQLKIVSEGHVFFLQDFEIVSKSTIRSFILFHLKTDQTFHTEVFPALNAVAENIHMRKILDKVNF